VLVSNAYELFKDDPDKFVWYISCMCAALNSGKITAADRIIEHINSILKKLRLRVDAATIPCSVARQMGGMLFLKNIRAEIQRRKDQVLNHQARSHTVQKQEKDAERVLGLVSALKEALGNGGGRKAVQSRCAADSKKLGTPATCGLMPIQGQEVYFVQETPQKINAAARELNRTQVSAAGDVLVENPLLSAAPDFDDLLSDDDDAHSTTSTVSRASSLSIASIISSRSSVVSIASSVSERPAKKKRSDNSGLTSLFNKAESNATIRSAPCFKIQHHRDNIHSRIHQELQFASLVKDVEKQREQNAEEAFVSADANKDNVLARPEPTLKRNKAAQSSGANNYRKMVGHMMEGTFWKRHDKKRQQKAVMPPPMPKKPTPKTCAHMK
jgi:hypothetical protein